MIRTERFLRRALSLATLLPSLTLAGGAAAQAQSGSVSGSPTTESPVTESPTALGADGGADFSAVSAPGPARVPWHDSLFIWDHSATTETLGIGSDVQSRNPTYEMSFRLAPRYYVVDAAEREVSVRGDIALIREFTDSDTTTQRGEWTFTDAELWLLFAETLHEAPGTKTDLVIRAPSLRLPTSDASLSNGRLLGLGAGLGLDQRVPLAGDRAPLFPGTLLRPRIGYTYQFARATVPTNDEIDRVRLTPDGQSLPSDQLSGTAFPQHELTAAFSVETDVTKRLGLVTEFGMRFARRYALAEEERVCGVVSTGCVTVESSADAPRWGVATLFAVDVTYLLGQSLILRAGYANLAGQLGADGQRQSIFYSPNARFGASAIVILDSIYDALTGRARAEAASRESRSSAF